jgi:Tfp pilus assembly pilus retraction ATPase PilT
MILVGELRDVETSWIAAALVGSVAHDRGGSATAL